MSPEIVSFWPVRRSKKWGNNLPTQKYLNPLPLIIRSPLLTLPFDGAGFTWWLVIHACNTSCWHVERYSIETRTPCLSETSLRGTYIEQCCNFSLYIFFVLKKVLQNFRTSILTITNPSLKSVHTVSCSGLCCSWSTVSIGTLILNHYSENLFFLSNASPALHFQLLQGQLLLTLSQGKKSVSEWGRCPKFSSSMMWMMWRSFLIHTERLRPKLCYSSTALSLGQWQLATSLWRAQETSGLIHSWQKLSWF